MHKTSKTICKYKSHSEQEMRGEGWWYGFFSWFYHLNYKESFGQTNKNKKKIMHINNDTYGNMSDGYIDAGTTLRRPKAN